MDLSAGRELSHYRLIEPIGEGGMGVVWKATDTTLGREVAIKILPAVFASDPERMARFEREARLLASLNHPHIAAIYGVGVVEGVRFLAMELVEGDDLAVRLSRGPLTILETVEMGRELAEALESAHEKGIIHRDLKPANIKLNAEARVKVLDFGLAKALDADAPASSASSSVSMSPTLTSPMTAANVILGTAAYMSPEQARGKTVDRRADIWAFGCVLYECLTARRPFPGETVSDTIAKILERDPDWSALPAGTPPRLRDLLRRCLEKDARKRLRDIGDARIELEELLAAGVTSSAIASALPVAATARGLPRSTALAMGVAALAIAIAIATVLQWAPWRRAPRAVPAIATITGASGTFFSGIPSLSTISPDGTVIALWATDSAGNGRLMLRPLASLEARLVPGTEFGSSGWGMPFWSPDGRRIGFFAEGKLRTVPVGGGTPQVLCDAADARGGTWNKDGVIIFAPTNQSALYRVSQTGGQPVAITSLDSTKRETAHRFPRFLPDGRHFTYVALPGSEGKVDTYVAELGSNKRRPAVRAESGAFFALPGHMVFTRDQSIVVQAFSLGRMQLEGEPIAVGDVPDEQVMLGGLAGSASDNGTLLFPTSTSLRCRLQWFGRDGKPQEDFPIPVGDYRYIAFSPDGKRVALLRPNSASSNDFWIADVARANLTRLTTDGMQKSSPRWSGDGTRIAYARMRGGEYDFFQYSVTGAGGEQPLFVSSSPYKDFTYLTPDDSLLVYSELGNQTNRDIWVVPLKGDRKPVPYLVSPFADVSAQLSPDKRWMLYESDESGRLEVYVQSYPVAGSKLQISNNGSSGTGWSRDGTEILFTEPRGFMAVAVKSGATFTASEPRLLLAMPKDVVTFGVSPDHQRFLFALPAGDKPKASLTVLMNWPSLRER